MNVLPTYKRVDTCAAEFEALTPYLYSSYDLEDESDATERKKVLILGGGPNRIGQVKQLLFFVKVYIVYECSEKYFPYLIQLPRFDLLLQKSGPQRITSHPLHFFYRRYCGSFVETNTLKVH